MNPDNPHNIAVLESNCSPRFFHLYELINLFILFKANLLLVPKQVLSEVFYFHRHTYLQQYSGI